MVKATIVEKFDWSAMQGAPESHTRESTIFKGIVTGERNKYDADGGMNHLFSTLL